ncbi:MAG: DNA mismatch repair protein MutS [Deltaproteobacteria bacterium]|nr:DNA mismatch repair protein MutS [Deltaproteobacteria bacterium]
MKHSQKQAAQKLTPMMRQYLEIKASHQDAILFFRLGDFYEMFFEDATLASELLGIALTSRDKDKEEPIPFCGVPYHAAQAYIRKLTSLGHKVAICEQVEDPSASKGIVKREVVRIITPGLTTDEEGLSPQEANYLAALTWEKDQGYLIFLDLSTGEMFLSQAQESIDLIHEVLKHPVKELLVESKSLQQFAWQDLSKQKEGLLVESLPETSSLHWEAFSQSLKDKIESLPSLALQNTLIKLLHYVYQTQKCDLKHLGPLQTLAQSALLKMDVRTFRHLELTQNAADKGRRGTLFWVLDQTVTAMGARNLARWIHYPSANLKKIEERLDAVAELVEDLEKLLHLQESLKPIRDLERMLGKLALRNANARDLKELGLSLKQAHLLVLEMSRRLKAPLFQKYLKAYPQFADLAENLVISLLEDLPLSIREGGMIASGLSPELDELREIRDHGQQVIAKMESEERQRTKINNLKIRYNKVFGYFIEVSRSHQSKVPPDYERKQTLANAERYITPALKDYESKVLSAQERIKSLEYELLVELREKAAAHLGELRQAARILASLDVLGALAKVARENHYVRPSLTEEKVLNLIDSRHPVLEKLHQEEKFIPNDLEMDEEKRLFLITGPNMAGKSTLMRQAALAILMAQMGSFVPAGKAVIGLTDQIFTRIGASDDLSQGQSTFMVEMLETAHILKNATDRSFIVLDEIGRGTSTYDGMSLAWAITESVASQIKARALCATHYHELTALADQLEGVLNYQVSVKEWNGKILFLRKLVPGGASRSYGIEVARLAGLPESLLERAKHVLKELEKSEDHAFKKLEQEPKPQLGLFEVQGPSELEKALSALEPDQLSPKQALELLYLWKQKWA